MLKLCCPKHKRYTGETSPPACCMTCIELRAIRLRAIAERLAVVKAPPSKVSGVRA